MPARKIVCIGAGSFYFPRAIADLVICRDLEGSEIVLYDIDGEKARRMAGMGQRLRAASGLDFKVRATTSLADAVDGADFALSSIGGSGAEITQNVYGSRYHNADVAIPARYGIHQVVGDTCGPAGMMMGFRSIPAYLKICREMEKRCPKVMLFNHSNPMAALCRAMHKYSSINVVGVCHGVQGGIMYAGEILGIAPQELDCVWIGTNHYYWFTRVAHFGKDMYPELRKRMARRKPPKGCVMSAALSAIYGFHIVYPADDHIIEFYPFSSQAGDFDSLPYGLGDEVRLWGRSTKVKSPAAARSPSGTVRRRFFKQYQKVLDEVQPIEKMDDSVTGEGIAGTISAIATGRRRVCIVNVANNGAIPNLPPMAEVEIEGVTDSCGVRGVQMGECPLVLKGLLEKRFVWHELVADAAVKGDRNLALQALLTDENAIAPDKASRMLDELLRASRPLLPGFFK